jgi:hypothetical protein
VQNRFVEVEAVCAERYQAPYGVYRPVIGRAVEKSSATGI